MIKKAMVKVMKYAGTIKKLYIIVRDNEYWQPKVMTIDNTLERVTDEQVAITGNFNAETLTSIWENGHIAITLWNKSLNKGYQLVGLPVKIDILSINPLPQGSPQSSGKVQAVQLDQNLAVQVERKIYFKVEEIIEFDNNPEVFHESDLDEIREEIEAESIINF